MLLAVSAKMPNSGKHSRLLSTPIASAIHHTLQYGTRMLFRVKHTSLLRQRINYGQIGFISLNTATEQKLTKLVTVAVLLYISASSHFINVSFCQRTKKTIFNGKECYTIEGSSEKVFKFHTPVL
jgi:hypothetical protein